jgi:hypothetical protein
MSENFVRKVCIKSVQKKLWSNDLVFSVWGSLVSEFFLFQKIVLLFLGQPDGFYLIYIEIINKVTLCI